MIYEDTVHSGIPRYKKLDFNSLKTIWNDTVYRPIEPGTIGRTILWTETEHNQFPPTAGSPISSRSALFRRRFEKRIYIALPDEYARTAIFKIHVGNTPNQLTEADYKELGHMTERCACLDAFLMSPQTAVPDWRRSRRSECYGPRAFRGPAILGAPRF